MEALPKHWSQRGLHENSAVVAGCLSMLLNLSLLFTAGQYLSLTLSL